MTTTSSDPTASTGGSERRHERPLAGEDDKTVLCIDGVTGPIYARPADAAAGYDYEVLYTGGSLLEFETAFSVETLCADHGFECISLDESPFADDGPDAQFVGGCEDGEADDQE
jgi:hypothetical protein